MSKQVSVVCLSPNGPVLYLKFQLFKLSKKALEPQSSVSRLQHIAV